MILNDEQKARMSKFIEFVDIEDICDIMCELPCVMCPLHEKCPMKEELDANEDIITINTCHDIVRSYIMNGVITDRRNEVEDEKNNGR